MPQVHGKVVNRQAIVEVGIVRFIPPQYSGDAQSNLQIPIESYRALLDTGAQSTCVTERVVQEAGLVSCGKIQIVSAGITKPHKQYMVDVAIFFDSDKSEGENFGNSQRRGYFGAGTLVTVGIDDNTMFEVIIGMDILAHHNLSFHRNGEFTLDLA